MIARILKWLMLLQVLAVLAVAYLAMQAWGVASPAMAVLLALAMLLAVRALIVARNFWQSRTRRQPRASAISVGCAGRRAPVPGRIARHLVDLVVGHAAAAPAGAGGATDAGDLPVLLIHGYVCNRGYWTQLSRQLARAGIAHDAVDLEPIAADIEDFVPQVEQAITQLCARTGSGQVILVAHSMGGLVARAWLRRHGGPRGPHHHHRHAAPWHGAGQPGGGQQCAPDEPHQWRTRRSAVAAGRQRDAGTARTDHFDVFTSR